MQNLQTPEEKRIQTGIICLRTSLCEGGMCASLEEANQIIAGWARLRGSRTVNDWCNGTKTPDPRQLVSMCQQSTEAGYTELAEVFHGPKYALEFIGGRVLNGSTEDERDRIDEARGRLAQHKQAGNWHGVAEEALVCAHEYMNIVGEAQAMISPTHIRKVG